MGSSGNILIIEDDRSVRDFVESVLQLEGYQPVGAADGQTGMWLFQQHAPRLIILDIGLPDLTGFQILEQVRQVDDTPIIMLTIHDAEEDKLQAFSMGADDYLTKPFSARELVARIQVVLRRGSGLTAGKSRKVVGEIAFDPNTRQVWVAGRPVHLSRTEFSLLVELASTPGCPCHDQQLLVKVWGESYRDEREILRRTIARLRQRLEPNVERYQYILRQPGVGYLLQVPHAGAKVP